MLKPKEGKRQPLLYPLVNHWRLQSSIRYHYLPLTLGKKVKSHGLIFADQHLLVHQSTGIFGLWLGSDLTMWHFCLVYQLTQSVGFRRSWAGKWSRYVRPLPIHSFGCVDLKRNPIPWEPQNTDADHLSSVGFRRRWTALVRELLIEQLPILIRDALLAVTISVDFTEAGPSMHGNRNVEIPVKKSAGIIHGVKQPTGHVVIFLTLFGMS